MNPAHRSLWILTALTVLAAGLAAQALAAPAGPGTDIQLAASALLLLTAGSLLTRVIAYLSRPPSALPPRHQSRTHRER